MTEDPRPMIERAVARGATAYIAARKARVPEFVERHFSFRGAAALHRKTFGHDFYRHPVNLLWSVPASLAHGAGSLLGKAGAERAANWLKRVPPGLPTALRAELEWLIHTELLELPLRQADRESRRDALLEAILAEPEIATLCEAYLAEIQSRSAAPEFRARLERNLAEYAKTRTAASELAGSLLNLAAGFAVLKQATPGALSAGTAAATVLAQHIATANFWLGSVVGSWYYALFPVTATAGLIAATTAALMAAVGILAALSSVVFDPLLARTGLHQKRLERFIDALGDELSGEKRGDYQVRDQYAARVFDIVDLLRTAAKTVI